jgi:hypothetical protein
MAKKTTPVITHIEILCLALRCLEHDIDQVRKQCDGIPGAEAMLQYCIDEKEPKMEALRMLYRTETGTDYV